MKKIVFLTFLLCTTTLIFCACEMGETDYEWGYECGYDAGYEWGYESGRDEGHTLGMCDALEQLEEEYSLISYGVSNPYGSPENAISIINDYINGVPVTEETLKEAIQIMQQYYEEICDLIYNPDSYICW